MSSVSQFPPSHLLPEEEDEESVKKNEKVNGVEAKDSKYEADRAEAGSGGGGSGSEGPRLALPAPGDVVGSSLQVDEQDNVFKFDHLGPMVVNTNGTLSRIHNWATLTEGEKERTMRVLVKRNKSRLEEIKRREEEDEQEKSRQEG